MIEDRVGVVCTDEAPTTLLELERRCPGLVDVLCWILFELRDPFSDVVSVLVLSFEKGNRRVNLPVLMEKRRGRQP